MGKARNDSRLVKNVTLLTPRVTVGAAGRIFNFIFETENLGRTLVGEGI